MSWINGPSCKANFACTRKRSDAHDAAALANTRTHASVQRESERARERQGDKETERLRQRERDRERQRYRERERETVVHLVLFTSLSVTLGFEVNDLTSDHKRHDSQLHPDFV